MGQWRAQMVSGLVGLDPHLVQVPVEFVGLALRVAARSVRRPPHIASSMSVDEIRP